MAAIFCDLEKAFDNINQDILISKLNFYGVKGKTLLRFKSYLSNRYQRVILIKLLKPKHSSGNDGISSKLMKLGSLFISSPLTYICNKCLFSGTFADRMKCAVVNSLFKKVDKSKTSNYRPIFILSSFSKILEKLCLTNSKTI